MPAVDIDLDYEISDEIAQFRELSDEWPDHRAAILDAIAEDLVGELKREIPTNTGRAKTTVRKVDRGGGDVSVVAGGEKGVDYIEPLLYGSEPHAPGPPTPEANPSLARWAQRNNYPGGFESIYWNIAKHGTEAHDFVSEPVRKTETDAADIGEQVLRNRGAFD